MARWMITVDPKNSLKAELKGPGLQIECVLGKNGVIAASQKTEGDSKTPLGIYPVRRVFYRPDREVAPHTPVPVVSLSPDLGWCDDSEHSSYNRMIRLPNPARHEDMWREDQLYDLGLIIGHNDDPVVPGAGSAIFIHVAKPATDDQRDKMPYKPTLGCVAMASDDLRLLIANLKPNDKIAIIQEG